MNPLIAVTDNFACRNKSKLKTFVGVFHLLKFRCKKNQWFDLSVEFQKLQLFGRDRERRYEASIYGELRVSISRWNTINSILWNIGRPVFQCWEQNRQHYHRDCFPTRKTFIESLIKEMKPIVMGEKEGWVWTSRKDIDGRFCLEVVDYPDSDTTKKKRQFFTSKLLQKCYVSDWVHDGGIRTCNSWGT